MSDDAGRPTRERLLAAGARLFAAQGLEATSVRQICAEAGANVAAVSYHFGSKQDLYDAAIDFARARSNERNRWVALDEHRDFWSHEPPERRLHLFVAMMLDHALDEDGEATELSRIMMHEMLDPSPAFDRQVEVSIARVFAALREICRSIAGAGADDATLTRVALSINAQCMYPALAAGCVRTLHPELRLDRPGRAALADLVATSAIRTLREPRTPATTSAP